MAKKRRSSLGRGLDALLSPAAPPPKPGEAPAPGADRLRDLPIDLLQRGRYQPRIDMRTETLQELADSIKAQGVVQPIVVRPLPAHAGTAVHYEIIAGERRWRAAQMAGLEKIPAVIRDVSDRAAIAMALIENIQRENLNPMEECRALGRLLEEFEMTHQEAAEAVGRSRAAVSNLLRLAELDGEVQHMVERRELDMGHARALLGLAGARQMGAAKLVVTKGLSVRETERLVKRLKSPAAAKPGAAAKDPDVLRLERELSERLGARVRLETARGGKGKLLISFNSLDELDGIIAHIK